MSCKPQKISSDLQTGIGKHTHSCHFPAPPCLMIYQGFKPTGPVERESRRKEALQKVQQSQEEDSVLLVLATPSPTSRSRSLPSDWWTLQTSCLPLHQRKKMSALLELATELNKRRSLSLSLSSPFPLSRHQGTHFIIRVPHLSLSLSLS